MQGLRGHTTGYAVPTYVIDAPGGGGKIPLLPDYVVGREGDDLILKNFEGNTYRYTDPNGDGWWGPHVRRRVSMMRIALVYDLRDEYRALGYSEEEIAEFDSVGTIEALASALETLGCEPVRVGRGQALAARLVAGERFDLVFSIAEGLKGRSREAQVPALCELFDQPYLFSDPLTAAAALDKGVAKRLVGDAGVKTPAFAIAQGSASEVAGWIDFPAFVKPLAEGTGKGCEAASSGQYAGRACGGGDARDRALQAAGVGRALSAGSRVHRRHRRQWRRRARARRVRDPAPRGCRGQCLLAAQQGAVRGPRHLCAGLRPRGVCWPARGRFEAYKALECRDTARIDFRSDANGEPCFLEANSLAGLNPWHSDLPILAAQNGIEFTGLIGMILDAGLARYGLARSDTERLRRTA